MAWGLSVCLFTLDTRREVRREKGIQCGYARPAKSMPEKVLAIKSEQCLGRPMGASWTKNVSYWRKGRAGWGGGTENEAQSCVFLGQIVEMSGFGSALDAATLAAASRSLAALNKPNTT